MPSNGVLWKPHRVGGICGGISLSRWGATSGDYAGGRQPGDTLGFPGAKTVMKDDAFQDMAMSYRGGALDLRNVCFYNVRFDIVDNENGRELAHALLSSKDNCVTLSLP